MLKKTDSGFFRTAYTSHS